MRDFAKQRPVPRCESGKLRGLDSRQPSDIDAHQRPDRGISYHAVARRFQPEATVQKLLQRGMLRLAQALVRGRCVQHSKARGCLQLTVARLHDGSLTLQEARLGK
jgi:hypothetical protein